MLGFKNIGVGCNTYTLSKGVPYHIVVDGVVYERLRFGDAFLDILISIQPLYAMAS